ncbi:MFS general substrate transporter [Atractiella rhizophila]|nr:MFS general substrate transporter [Atractiella rhizophila]
MSSRTPESVDSKEDVKQVGGSPSPAANVGVEKIEALYKVFNSGGWTIWLLYLSIGLVAYSYSLSSNTVGNYLVFATSDLGRHSAIGTIDTAIYILGAVSQPFIAKFADISSRPFALLVCLLFYVVGFIVVASGNSVNTLVAGELIYTIGNTGINLMINIIVSDISPLKWRALVNSLCSSPYIVNAFIAGYIVDGVGEGGWRWGYGMFAIIMPAVMAPALLILFWGDWKAKQIGTVSLAASSHKRRVQLGVEQRRMGYLELAYLYWRQIDGFGLILLGVAWALIFLPLTLYKTAENGWKNPSLIAMEVVGGLLIIALVYYELRIAEYPLIAKEILAKNWIIAVFGDVIYFIAGNMRSTYFSSWVYVVTDWSLKDWTYFTQTLTVGLCVFGLMAGLIIRVTHRFKYLLIIGHCIKTIGMGLTLYARGDNATAVALVWTQILIAIGGGILVNCNLVASQASIPHSALATAIAQLALWTKLGGAIGTAIAAAVWTDQMPINLRNELSGQLNSTQITSIYNSIRTARSQPAEIREGVIRAYDKTVYRLYVPALCISFIPPLLVLFMTNYYLGDSYNTKEERKDKEANVLAPVEKEKADYSDKEGIVGEDEKVKA